MIMIFMIGVNVYREEEKCEHFRGMEQVPHQDHDRLKI